MRSAKPSVAVIGGGPSGLIAAEVLAEGGAQVDVYDAMPSLGRKFLMAGKGGLNLTHAEPYESFISRYGSQRAQLEPVMAVFGPDALRQWASGLNVDTFVGSSGRVFPIQMKAAPLLRRCLHRLRERGVNFHARHRWLGWNADGWLRFSTPQGEQAMRADASVLALGGGSWARLGSDAAWVPILRQHGVAVAPLKPANCGFDIGWTEHFRSRFAGQPLKTIAVGFIDRSGHGHYVRGECVVTETGLEGGVIYTLSAPLRDAISAEGSARIVLDLQPSMGLDRLFDEIAEPRGTRSWSTYLRRRVGLAGAKAGLLHEVAGPGDFTDLRYLAALIKALPLRLIAARPIDEAISTAGGVCFEALDRRLMLRDLPGVFCAGEMLDWEAPTGGYLLTACFATGHAAGRGALAWLKDRGAQRQGSQGI
jgi:hypothetical protein